eukprot:1868463-Pleurochrysis_carterae.AAC.1
MLGVMRVDEWVRGEPTAKQEAGVADLRQEFQKRVREAADHRKLATALEWWADYLKFSGRVPFADPSRPGKDKYNAETMELFAEYIR